MDFLWPIAAAVVERGAELPGDGQLPLAPVLDSDHTAALAMVIALYAGFGAAVLWAIWKYVREREGVPLILLAAGVIAANMEPLGDHVGQIVYAPDIPWFDYEILGRQMPSFILVGLAAYVACGSYYAGKLVAEGASFQRMAFVSAVLVGIPEIVMEMLWRHWDIIAYYGDNPTRVLGVPLYSIVQNTTLLPVYGVVTFYALERLRGPQRLWLLVLTPGVTIGYIVGVSWPVYQAIGSSADALVVWGAALVTIVASLASAAGALQLPEVRARRAAATGAPPEPARAAETVAA